MFSQPLYDAIQASNDAGIMFVAAAGNENNDNDASPTYPASYDLPGIIAVGATDHNDLKAGFSCFGATSVDLGAPGVDILSTLPGNAYESWSGTSMATPHVAGAVGLINGLAPGLSLQEVKDLILNNVDPIPALDGLWVTGGRLNLQKAIEAVGLRVVSSSPAENSVVTDPVSDFVVDFSDAYDPATVDATDLTVNGIPADSVDQTDADTLTFHFVDSPVTNQGLQTMAMA